MKKAHVVVLVLENNQQQILVTQRHLKKHLGGLWEFPGGKVEKNEQPLQALKREMAEEVDYDLKTAQPLITLKHQYPEIAVTLDVWYCQDDNPKVAPKENQPLSWHNKHELYHLKMPAANQTIIKKILSDT